MDTKTSENKHPVIWLVVLHLAFLIYSSSTLVSKLASGEEFLSIRFCGLYAGVIILLGIYAVIWQQVLKHLPLVFAYANKAVTVIWGMVFGYCIFAEQITLTKVIGAVIIIAGIVIFSLGEDTADE